MEYVIAYCPNPLAAPKNQAIAPGECALESIVCHVNRSPRNLVYVYEHNPEGFMRRGEFVAIATPEGWYPRED